MIKWKESRRILTDKNKNGYVAIVMVGWVCDKCGKEKQTKWRTVKTSRERRGEETDCCYECAQKGRPMPKGSADPKWKHGKTYNGYTRITRNGKRMLEHVAIMEDHLGRKMNKGELIHHIDMDKNNNHLSNLRVFSSKSEHVSCHNAMEHCGYALLNKSVWFDWEKKQYVLEKTKSVEFPTLQELHLPTGKLDKNGYLCYKRKRHHILVAEVILGRRLLRDECVHHVDGNKANNNPANLYVTINHSEHAACHAALQKVVATLYKKGVVKFESGGYHVAV